MHNLDALLGIDPETPVARRARDLLEADRALLKELVQRRVELGLTQSEVARRMDISQSAVARIEAGSRDLHQSTIRRYAMAVEVVIHHDVVKDDPARARAARMVTQHQNQLRIAQAEVWLPTDVGSAAERLGLDSWSRLVRATRTKSDA